MSFGWEPDDVVAIVRQLEETHNTEALSIIKNALQTSAYNYGKRLRAQVADNNLANYDSLFSGGPDGDCRTVKLTDDELISETSRCRIFDIFKSLNATDIGFQYKCRQDFGMIKGYNENIDLAIEQCLMKGDPICRHVYRKRKA
jgi:hypothetical protein